MAPDGRINTLHRHGQRMMLRFRIQSAQRSGQLVTCFVLSGRKAARDIAEAGAVLLKNDRCILPVKSDALKNIAWVGLPFERPVIGGGGSAQVTPTNITSIRQLLKSAHGIDKPLYAPGIDTNGTAIPIRPCSKLFAAKCLTVAMRPFA